MVHHPTAKHLLLVEGKNKVLNLTDPIYGLTVPLTNRIPQLKKKSLKKITVAQAITALFFTGTMDLFSPKCSFSWSFRNYCCLNVESSLCLCSGKLKVYDFAIRSRLERQTDKCSFLNNVVWKEKS